MIDPQKHQYGNFITVTGHGIVGDQLKEIEFCLQVQIDETFKECQTTPKIKQWKSEKWMMESKDGEHQYLDYEVDGSVPVTLFCWKSKLGTGKCGK